MDLPIDLFQLIVLMLSDEDKESLSCTSRALCSSMQRLYHSQWFWRERYTQTYEGSSTAVDCLLPEVIDHYGWRKLWYRVRGWNRGWEDDLFIGSTGNVIMKHKEKKLFVTILPIARDILIKRQGRNYVVLYFDLEQRIKIFVIRESDTPSESHWTIDLANSPTVHSYLSTDCHIFVQEDGSVIVIHRTHDKLMALINSSQETIHCHEVGINITSPLRSWYSVIENENVFVDTFDVTFRKGETTLFSCSRSSPTHLKLLQEEITKRLGK